MKMMKGKKLMKPTTNIMYPAIAVFAFACVALLPGARAVSPAPDGGYPGGNTAEGQSALLSLTTGTSNTAVGWFSLKSLTTGKFCTGVGAATLLLNTADGNTATGTGALLSNTTGIGNTANGAFTLLSNTTGSGNTAVGNVALEINTGGENTALGNAALQDNTTGSGNTAVGHFALSANSGATAMFNTAVGDTALGFNGTGAGNTAVGADALCCADAGNSNTVVGSQAMALVIGSTGNNNTALGGAALSSSTANNNTAIGYKAGYNQTNGSNNVYIGADIQGVAGESDTCRIKSIFGQTAANGSAVFITSGNKLGTDTSSKRFKDHIEPMDKASEALLALKPVTFRYKKEIDPAGIAQFGLVAEEVEKVNPDLVVRDTKGNPYSVRYDQVNAMLLNEFLKEHKKVDEQQASISELNTRLARQDAIIAQQQKSFQSQLAKQEKQIEALALGLQQVSAQVEMSKPATKVVLNSQ